MISNTDSTLLIYSTKHMLVKVYKGRGPGNSLSRRAGMHQQTAPPAVDPDLRSRPLSWHGPFAAPSRTSLLALSPKRQSSRLDRKRVVKGKRGDLGGARILKKKKREVCGWTGG